MNNKGNTDRIENFSGASIQHGPYNDRVYLLRLGNADPQSLAAELRELARNKGYSKIFAKVPRQQALPFLTQGYHPEAKIPSYYGPGEDALFLCFYLNEKRQHEENGHALQEIIHTALRKAALTTESPRAIPHFSIRPCTENDVEAMAALYAAVFPSYPFPIHDPAYLLETMRSHVDYFCIEHEDRPVALASAEMDKVHLSVEMTDFATIPDFEGKGFATMLLREMEIGMLRKGVTTAYTIARAASTGMNIVFARHGYLFGGRLINNTNISGHIESMNVWFKEFQHIP